MTAATSWAPRVSWPRAPRRTRVKGIVAEQVAHRLGEGSGARAARDHGRYLAAQAPANTRPITAWSSIRCAKRISWDGSGTLLAIVVEANSPGNQVSSFSF